MSANGTSQRSLSTHYKVTAVAALPHSHLRLLEYLLHLYVGKKLVISLLVRLFDSCNSSELECKSLEALFLSFLSKGVVHIGPLIVLALCCCNKVSCGVTKAAKCLEPEFSMLLLVVCGLLEDSCDLLVAFLLCYGCKLGVIVSSLRFACESGHKILFCLGSLKIHFEISFISVCFFHFNVSLCLTNRL